MKDVGSFWNLMVASASVDYQNLWDFFYNTSMSCYRLLDRLPYVFHSIFAAIL